MSILSSPNKQTLSDYTPVEDEDSIIRINNAKIFNHRKRPDSDINISPIRPPGGRKFDWPIFSVKVLCFVCVVIAWMLVLLPYTSLIEFFSSPDVSCCCCCCCCCCCYCCCCCCCCLQVNSTDSLNTQTGRIDKICNVINNSSLGFESLLLLFIL